MLEAATPALTKYCFTALARSLDKLMLYSSVPSAEAYPSKVTVPFESRNSLANLSKVAYDSVFNTELSNSKPIGAKYAFEVNSCLGSGNLIGQPEPSTTVPAGVLGHLSNLSETPSPSESLPN